MLPAISGGDFGYEKVNVAPEQRDPGSFLNWIERMTTLVYQVISRFPRDRNARMMAVDCSQESGTLRQKA